MHNLLTTTGGWICPICGKSHPMWVTECAHYTVESKSAQTYEKYPLSDSQLAQIDCRRDDCIFNGGAGVCKNISPALTLNPNGMFVCWSMRAREDE